MSKCYNCNQIGHRKDACPNPPKYIDPSKVKDKSQVECFKCKQKGHYSDKCPQLQLQRDQEREKRDQQRRKERSDANIRFILANACNEMGPGGRDS